MGPVSCLSATACVAIVFNYPKDGAQGDSATLVRWNGRTWSALAPIPPGEIYDVSGFADVSCTSIRACVVMLPTFDSAPDSPVFSWDGRSWHAAPASLYQDLNSGLGGVLEGVSCGSPTVCTIVGSNFTGGFVAALTDGTVQLQQAAPPPGPSGDRVDLNSVSCVTTMCMVVGDSADETGTTTQTLAEQYR
jgi:hypothetical protein